MGGNIRIEKVTRDTFDAFYKVAKKLVNEQYIDYPPWQRKYYWKRHFNLKGLKKGLNINNFAFIAFKNKKVIAFILVKIGGAGGAEFDWIMVDEKFRGRGIGSELLIKAEAEVHKYKCHFIYLYTESLRNVKLYKRFGFYLVGLHKESWFGNDEYLMQKNIAKPDLKYLRKLAETQS